MDLRGKSYVGLKLQTFAYFVYNASCAVSRCLGRFLLSVFLDAFSFDLTLSFTSISPQFDGVRLRVENFPRIQWAIFVASRSRGPKIVSILRLRACTRLLFYQIQKKINSSDSRFISFTMIYTFLWL